MNKQKKNPTKTGGIIVIKIFIVPIKLCIRYNIQNVTQEIIKVGRTILKKPLNSLDNKSTALIMIKVIKKLNTP